MQFRVRIQMQVEAKEEGKQRQRVPNNKKEAFIKTKPITHKLKSRENQIIKKQSRRGGETKYKENAKITLKTNHKSQGSKTRNPTVNTERRNTGILNEYIYTEVNHRDKAQLG